jgi:sulfite exporter TauE/SafE
MHFSMQVERLVQEYKVSQAREHYEWFQQYFALGIVWGVMFCVVVVSTLLPVIIALIA